MRWLVGALLSVLCSSVCSAQVYNVSEQYLLAAANADRQSLNLPPLRIDPALALAAANHAREMAGHEGISHQFPSEPDLALRAGSHGVRFSLITENVAEASSAVVIHSLWMKSAGHRANLLDKNVDVVGIAVVSRAGQLYAVEDFARSVQVLSLAQQEARVSELLNGSGLTVASNHGDARRTCQLATGYAGSRKPWFVMRYTTADLGHLPPELTQKIDSEKYSQAAVGACEGERSSTFSQYALAILLFP